MALLPIRPWLEHLIVPPEIYTQPMKNIQRNPPGVINLIIPIIVADLLNADFNAEFLKFLIALFLNLHRDGARSSSPEATLTNPYTLKPTTSFLKTLLQCNTTIRQNNKY